MKAVPHPPVSFVPDSRTLLSLTLVAALTTACGGGGSPTVSSAPTPTATPPAQPRSAEPLPYWVTSNELRPNLRHLAAGDVGSSPVVTLSADERRQVAASRVLPAAASRPAVAAVAVQRRTVTGLASIIWHTTAGSTQQPLNLTGNTIEAYAPDGLGGFEVIPAGAKRTDGTYTITNVPEGPHWVRRGSSYLWTDAGFVDWSSDTFGRSDVEFATLPTKLNFEAGNLASWQSSDTLHWVLPMQGASYALPLSSASAITNPPRTADTALAGFGMNLGDPDYLSGLLNAGKGDQAYLNQLATQPGTGVRTLSKSLVLPALTLADGSTTAVNSGFLDITPNASLRLRWDRSAYAAQAAAVNPAATLSSTGLGISAFALPPSLGSPSDAYTLLEFNTLGSGDIDFGRLQYGNPFPADWNRVVDGFVTFTVRYLAPGASVAEPLERGLSSTELLDPANRNNTSLTLAPRITPARQPQINGRSLFGNQLAVGTTPTLTWLPPAVGTPSHYFLRLLELRANGTRSEFAFVARFYTGDTSMTMPPGVLQAGKTYVITLAAIDSGSAVTQPFRSALPFAFATLMSGIISP